MEMKKLLESLEECGMGMPPAPMPEQHEGNPVSMNVSLNASGKEHVEDLINMMKNAGMTDAKPASADMLPMRMDMERLRDIVDGPKKLEPPTEEGYDNEPDEQYGSVDDIINSGDDLHKSKKSYPKANGGDNPMALEDDQDTLEQQILDALKAEYAKVNELWDDEEDHDSRERRIQDNGNTVNFNIDKSKPKSKWKYMGKEYTIYATDEELEKFEKGDFSKGWERLDKKAKKDDDEGAKTFPLPKRDKIKMKPLMPEPGEPGYPSDKGDSIRKGLGGLAPDGIQP